MQIHKLLVNSSLRIVRIATCCSCIFVFVGCGSGDVPKPIANLVPCSGTVTLDGNPLKNGSVGFAPADGTAGQPAAGLIKDGAFTMNTTASANGVVIGKYKVRVECDEEAPKPAPGAPLGATKPPVSLIPNKYTNPATSELEVDVTKGMAPVKFALVSKQ